MTQPKETSLRSAQTLEITTRPAPPLDLTEDEANEWNQIVSSLSADWFKRETHGLLAQYCRHVVKARQIAKLLQKVESEPDLDLSSYDKLLKMQERESRAIASLSTKMRLAQQSTIDSENKRKRVGRKPWEE